MFLEVQSIASVSLCVTSVRAVCYHIAVNVFTSVHVLLCRIIITSLCTLKLNSAHSLAVVLLFTFGQRLITRKKCEL